MRRKTAVRRGDDRLAILDGAENLRREVPVRLRTVAEPTVVRKANQNVRLRARRRQFANLLLDVMRNRAFETNMRREMERLNLPNLPFYLICSISRLFAVRAVFFVSPNRSNFNALANSANFANSPVPANLTNFARFVLRRRRRKGRQRLRRRSAYRFETPNRAKR